MFKNTEVGKPPTPISRITTQQTQHTQQLFRLSALRETVWTFNVEKLMQLLRSNVIHELI
jgi:hypothetical protein